MTHQCVTSIVTDLPEGFLMGTACPSSRSGSRRWSGGVTPKVGPSGVGRWSGGVTPKVGPSGAGGEKSEIIASVQAYISTSRQDLNELSYVWWSNIISAP